MGTCMASCWGPRFRRPLWLAGALGLCCWLAQSMLEAAALGKLIILFTAGALRSLSRSLSVLSEGAFSLVRMPRRGRFSPNSFLKSEGCLHTALLCFFLYLAGKLSVSLGVPFLVVLMFSVLIFLPKQVLMFCSKILENFLTQTNGFFFFFKF